jgi:hypothetical protein
MWGLLLQVPDVSDGPAPGAWVGAGLLGSVLAWLLFVHLPSKDKQAVAKDAQLLAALEAKDAMMRQHIQHVSEKFDTALKEMREQCQEELASLREILAKNPKAKG